MLELARLVKRSKLDLARIQLTIGYAEYMIGNHWEALGHLRQAVARNQGLSTRDISFTQTLKDACEFHAGLINSSEYERRARDRASALTGLEALESKQEALYRRCVSAIDLAKRTEEAKALRAVTEEILSHTDASPAIRLNSRLLLLFVEGVESNLAATRTAFAAEIRGQIFPGDVMGVTKTLLDARTWHLEWEAQANQALKDAYDLNHPVLIFQALVICLRIRIGRLFEQRQDAIINETPYIIQPNDRGSVERMIEQATKLNAANGSVEGRLQLAELQADFLELQDKRDEAKKLAAATYPAAQAMGVGTIADHAKRLLEDDTLLLQWEKSYRGMREEDGDMQRASQTDEQINRIAQQFLLSMESTPARREVLIEYLHSIRDIARERLSWCRHLQILEDLSMTTDPEVAFRELPSRKCRCGRYMYQTGDAGASADATFVISRFKQVFCNFCLGREPKLRESNSAL